LPPGLSTLAISPPMSQALTPPAVMTSTYAFEKAEAGEQIFWGEREGYVYGEHTIPTKPFLRRVSPI
jgi:O-acetylhomoserine/O-acetylserine sulfhydrylase-like pyridoxal-dependent enzyme